MATHAPSDVRTPDHGQVLALIAEVERSLGALRERAGDDAARAEEAGRLAREIAVLEDERARMLERQVWLEGRLAEERALRATDAERANEREAAARASIESLSGEIASLRDAIAERDGRLAELQASLESERARAAEFASRGIADETRMNEAIARLEAELASRTMAVELLESRAGAAEARAAEAESSFTAERTRLDAEIGEARAEIARRGRRLAALAAELGELRTQLGRAEHDGADRASGLETELRSCRDALSAAELRLAELETNRVELLTRAESAEREAARAAGLELELGTARADADELRARVEEATTVLEAERAALAQETSRAAAALADRDSRLASLEQERARLADELANALRQGADSEAIAARIDGLDAERTALRAEIASTETRAFEAQRAYESSAARVAALESELAAARSMLDEASATITALESRAPVAAQAAVPADVESLVAARAETIASELAGAKVDSILASRVAAMAEAAAFLQRRHERLSNLRKGIKARFRELRALRADIAEGRVVEAAPVSTPAPAPFVDESMVERLSAIDAERASLARERTELVELRRLIAEGEQNLARRAANSRRTTTFAVAAVFVTASALISWQVGGSIAPAPCVASVDLAVVERLPAGAEPSGATGAALVAPVADWIKSGATDSQFSARVAERLSDRGVPRSDALRIAGALMTSLAVEATDQRIHLSVATLGANEAALALDALATAAVTEGNRQPARGSDHLRVSYATKGDATATGPVIAVRELSNPMRLATAGGVFAAALALGAIAAWAFSSMFRRAEKAALAAAEE